MDTVVHSSGQKNRFLKLSLKKNKKNVVSEDRNVNSPYQDLSFEDLTRHVFRNAQKLSRKCSVITLRDSDSECSSKTSKSPVQRDVENDQNDDFANHLRNSDTEVQGLESLSLNTNRKLPNEKLSRKCSVITLRDSDSECSSKTSKSPVQRDVENDQNDDFANHLRNSDTEVQGLESLSLNTNRKLPNEKLSRKCSVITLRDSDSECSSKTSKSPVQSDVENDQNDNFANHLRNSDTEVQGFESLSLNTGFESLSLNTNRKLPNEKLSRKCSVITLRDSDSECSSKTSKSPEQSDFENDQNDDFVNHLRNSDTEVQGFERLSLNTNRKLPNEDVTDSKTKTDNMCRESKRTDKGHSTCPDSRNESPRINISITPNRVKNKYINDSDSSSTNSPVKIDVQNDNIDDMFDRIHYSVSDRRRVDNLNNNTNRISNELPEALDSNRRTEDSFREIKTNDKVRSLSAHKKITPVNVCLTTTTEHKVTRESIEHCAAERIRVSQMNLLDELYGEQWRYIPTLYKPSQQKPFDNIKARRLSFSDKDKENTEAKVKKTEKRIDAKKPDKKTTQIPSVTKKTKAKLLDELYGEQWRYIPTLNKPSQQKPFDNIKARRLSFSDKDKENTEAEGKKTEKRIDTKKPDKKTTQIPSVTKKTKEKTEIKKKVIVEKDVLKPTSKSGDGAKAKVCVGKVTSAVAKSVEKIEVKKLGFMASLADNVPTWRCDLEALDYKKNFKSKKELLTQKLYSIFNTMIFNRQLHENMLIEWDAKLRSTAGTTVNRLHRTKTSTGEPTRTSSIKLSTKVIDSAQRLRDTLVHEMCHAATWLVDHELRAGHGPLWKKWAAHSLMILPELGDISRCHDMQIHFKFTYKCTKCGYSINRHSKSIDTERKRCGYCYGTLELIVNKKTKDGLVVSTPAKPVEANDFALFVKKNYGSVKKDKTMTHAQVMKTLGEQYSVKKALRKNDGSEIK